MLSRNDYCTWADQREVILWGVWSLPWEPRCWWRWRTRVSPQNATSVLAHRAPGPDTSPQHRGWFAGKNNIRSVVMMEKANDDCWNYGKWKWCLLELRKDNVCTYMLFVKWQKIWGKSKWVILLTNMHDTDNHAWHAVITCCNYRLIYS